MSALSRSLITLLRLGRRTVGDRHEREEQDGSQSDDEENESSGKQPRRKAKLLDEECGGFQDPPGNAQRHQENLPQRSAMYFVDEPFDPNHC